MEMNNTKKNGPRRARPVGIVFEGLLLSKMREARQHRAKIILEHNELTWGNTISITGLRESNGVGSLAGNQPQSSGRRMKRYFTDNPGFNHAPVRTHPL